MKVIDLLNKIANGEDLPNTFKYREYLFYYDEYNNCYFEEGHKKLFDILAYLKGWSLNDKVEIIEEEKKIPERLSTWYSVEVTQSDEENVEYANCNFEYMYEKINEICDYLKSKGE